jgi:hypothetical protein
MLSQDLIILPVAAMVLLVALVSFRFLVLSISAERQCKRKADPAQANDQKPGKNQLAMNNVSNLFEMPVLFYVAAAFLFASDTVDFLYLTMAWFYVLLRYIHSYIHTTYNFIPHRLMAFLASNIILLAIWGRLTVQSLGRM